MNKKVKRGVIIGSSCAAAVVLIAGGIIFAQVQQNSNTFVDVVPVSNVSTMYWQDSGMTSGQVTSDYIQELYPETEKVINNVFVKEGDTVKIGDPLVEYDKTKLRLDLERKELDIKKAELSIEQAQNELDKLYNTSPYVPPAEPPAPPEPPEPPAPTPRPESSAKLHTVVGLDAEPYKGTGTSEDPYVFLCSNDCTITREFIMEMLGLNQPAPTPAPTQGPAEGATGTARSKAPAVMNMDFTPGEEGDPSPGPTDSPTSAPTDSPTSAPTDSPTSVPTDSPTPAPTDSPTPAPTDSPTPGPTDSPTPAPTEEPAPSPGGSPSPTPSPSPTTQPTPTPVPSKFNGPFAAVFEVRDDGTEYGNFVKGWKVDGEMGFYSMDIVFGGDVGDDDSAAMGIDAYGDMGGIAYNGGDADTPTMTQDEIDKAVKDKKNEIADLNTQRKKAILDRNIAQTALDNSTVLSIVNGRVKSLTDLETAEIDAKPYLVVAGGDGLYVTGTISESMLDTIQKGAQISASSWETGSSYTGTVLKVSEYPSENNYGYSENPNNSFYDFTALLEDADSLQSGTYLDIAFQQSSNTPSDALYVQGAYIRKDDGGKYVYKDVDGVLQKTYITVGMNIYGGEYTEVKDGLTMEDQVAFPYGQTVKDGVKTKSAEGGMLG